MPSPKIDVLIEQGTASLSAVPASVVDALQRVEVTRRADAGSTFRISFDADPENADLALLAEQLATPFARIRVTTVLQQMGAGAASHVLIDGFVTVQEYAAPTMTDDGSFTIGGEDACVRMAMVERSTEYPAMTDAAIVQTILSRYASIVDAEVVAPQIDIAPTLHVPQQNGTDLAYLRHLARRHGATFHVVPGSNGNKPVAHWGVPKKTAPADHALSVGAGAFGNVETLSFTRSMLAPTVAYAATLDQTASPPARVATAIGSAAETPGYAATPALADGDTLAKDPEGYTGDLAGLRLRGMVPIDYAPDAGRAKAIAQGLVDRAQRAVVTGRGTVDTAVYGELLLAPDTVQVRGAGNTFDGSYFLDEAVHEIVFGKKETRYRQHFTIAREGTGATSATVTP